MCFYLDLVLDNEEEVKLLSLYILKYSHKQDEMENEKLCGNVPAESQTKKQV